MNRRDFLRSLLAIAISLPVAPRLAINTARQIVVYPGGPLTIGKAIGLASDGDTILVEGGTYQGPMILPLDAGITFEFRGCHIIGGMVPT